MSAFKQLTTEAGATNVVIFLTVILVLFPVCLSLLIVIVVVVVVLVVVAIEVVVVVVEVNALDPMLVVGAFLLPLQT